MLTGHWTVACSPHASFPARQGSEVVLEVISIPHEAAETKNWVRPWLPEFRTEGKSQGFRPGAGESGKMLARRYPAAANITPWRFPNGSSYRSGEADDPDAYGEGPVHRDGSLSSLLRCPARSPRNLSDGLIGTLLATPPPLPLKAQCSRAAVPASIRPEISLNQHFLMKTGGR